MKKTQQLLLYNDGADIDTLHIWCLITENVAANKWRIPSFIPQGCVRESGGKICQVPAVVTPGE